ncbi:helix-turn-helix transcriptional regulator [Fulvivirga sp. 29W222]|uniref:Helix-turn-helix transcriptional regulator n=1 Tax=Fulvivirga marina TaxID=2494733 RepID=A0A937KEN6_9BACT|nr:helix-turn-helix transcriptional regulator [Fulvivirga marina]MBL6447350.1 helix-turn-helix transcriptional regulator [Fulvivirga marina]
MEELENQFSQIAVLIGDKARSIMLWNLLDGRAYTATELSVCANISPQSASNHLAKLVDANILSISKQGRHRYYNFKNDAVAQVVESMASLLPLQDEGKPKVKPVPPGIAYARTCYDHVAGRLGVSLTESLEANGFIKASGKEYDLTDKGREWFHTLGVDTEGLKQQKRSFAHQCLDWSERRSHLAGALGASMLQVMLQKDWVRKKNNTRELLITPKGKLELSDLLKLKI